MDFEFQSQKCIPDIRVICMKPSQQLQKQIKFLGLLETNKKIGRIKAPRELFYEYICLQSKWNDTIATKIEQALHSFSEQSSWKLKLQNCSFFNRVLLQKKSFFSKHQHNLQSEFSIWLTLDYIYGTIGPLKAIVIEVSPYLMTSIIIKDISNPNNIIETIASNIDLNRFVDEVLQQRINLSSIMYQDMEDMNNQIEITYINMFGQEIKIQISDHETFLGVSSSFEGFKSNSFQTIFDKVLTETETAPFKKYHIPIHRLFVDLGTSICLIVKRYTAQEQNKAFPHWRTGVSCMNQLSKQVIKQKLGPDSFDESYNAERVNKEKQFFLQSRTKAQQFPVCILEQIADQNILQKLKERCKKSANKTIDNTSRKSMQIFKQHHYLGNSASILSEILDQLNIEINPHSQVLIDRNLRFIDLKQKFEEAKDFQATVVEREIPLKQKLGDIFTMSGLYQCIYLQICPRKVNVRVSMNREIIDDKVNICSYIDDLIFAMLNLESLKTKTITYLRIDGIECRVETDQVLGKQNYLKKQKLMFKDRWGFQKQINPAYDVEYMYWYIFLLMKNSIDLQNFYYHSLTNSFFYLSHVRFCDLLADFTKTIQIKVVLENSGNNQNTLFSFQTMAEFLKNCGQSI